MLSICIPTYNYSVVQLVKDLSGQAAQLNIPYEIIVIDDASDPAYSTQNNILATYAYTKFIILHKNIGRSKIRNLFLEKASYNCLLFIDCDAQVCNPLFLKNYMDQINESPVIIGGVAYDTKQPEKDRAFRWKYGHSRETTNAFERSKNPYHSFKTFNFLITKGILEQVRFDERLTDYGHEDTLFGLELKKQNIQILHIENPLIHLGIETNDVFLSKTEKGIHNLLYINSLYGVDSDFAKAVKLLAFYNNKGKFTRKTIATIFNLTKHLLQKVIFRSSNMLLFDFYKIGYMCSIDSIERG
jgi:glycosyltransferase involved in cell wall biosynthesis